ncbi:MAG: 5-formyltetrahydrofolate cyclo-ligase [Deltaproteobacteria bacterium]|jgi:5-formyltetrahydrofolate cyclo-ligase|nr:5-formyltetrahydrofolate cyclo-ligase [Deltaproteobacteria bacterium]
MESKLQLYNRVLSTRDELSEEFVRGACDSIQRKILLMEEFRLATRIGLYSSFGSEVRTDLLFKEGDKNRKELYYPTFTPEGAGAAYYRTMNLGELEPGMHGKLEPTDKQSKLRDVSYLNALIVPGVVFDLKGGRIGFGKGFYDSCLAEFSGDRIALAYDFQVVSQLPVAVAGKKVDWIVTEERIIRC